MRQALTFLVWIAAAGSLAVAPMSAWGEGFLDFRAGVAMTNDSDFTITLKSDDFSPPLETSVLGRTSWKDSVTGGIRGGCWFPGRAKWLGLALDLSYFRLREDVPGDVEAVDIHAVPLSLLLMLRVPLITSESYPGGRLQPYVAVGPSVVTSSFSLDFVDPGLASVDLEAVGVDAAADVRAGLAVMLARHFGLFSEYRYTRVNAHYNDLDAIEMSGYDIDVKTKLKLRTHHVTAGVTVRF